MKKKNCRIIFFFIMGKKINACFQNPVVWKHSSIPIESIFFIDFINAEKKIPSRP